MVMSVDLYKAISSMLDEIENSVKQSQAIIKTHELEIKKEKRIIENNSIRLATLKTVISMGGMKVKEEK